MPIQSIKSGILSRSTAVGNAIILPGDYESIATVTVGSGGAANVEFTSIPGTYTHLQLRTISRCAAASGAGNTIQFNSDTGSNYARHYLVGDGSSATAGANATQTSLSGFIQQTVSGGLANTYGAMILDILDYANTNKYKTVRALTGLDLNGAGGEMDLFSGLWMSSSAITSITITGTNNFAQYSHFALYGIKG